MQTTMHLLEKARKIHTIAEWTKELKLSEDTLYVAKNRGRLSPLVAGALADKLGEDPQRWIVIAALETERESSVKTYLMKKLEQIKTRQL